MHKHTPPDDRLREIFDVVERHVEDRYGVPVIITDVANPFTGDLSGAEIQVDYDLTPEDAVFILAHLFGHTVQWNLSPEHREIGMAFFEDATEAQIQAVQEYERQACGFSLQLFHDAGVRDLDAWMSDFAACDTAYLTHFYRTGEKRPIRSFWVDDAPLITPLPIPDFQPTEWRTRWAGVVV